MNRKLTPVEKAIISIIIAIFVAFIAVVLTS